MQRFIDETRRLIGAPFVHQGRSARGLDCIGLIGVATSNAGLDLPTYCRATPRSNYAREAQPALLTMVEQYGTRIAAVVPGAVLLFRIRGAVVPGHVGIYTDRATIVHADARQGHLRVVENHYAGVWIRWTHSIWLVPGVDYGNSISSK